MTVEVALDVGVAVGGSVGVTVAVADAVPVGVAVPVVVPVTVGVGEPVGVAVGVLVGVSVGRGVLVMNWPGVEGNVAVGRPEVLVVEGVSDGPVVDVNLTASIVANDVLDAAGGGRVGAPSLSRL